MSSYVILRLSHPHTEVQEELDRHHWSRERCKVFILVSIISRNPMVSGQDGGRDHSARVTALPLSLSGLFRG